MNKNTSNIQFCMLAIVPWRGAAKPLTALGVSKVQMKLRSSNMEWHRSAIASAKLWGNMQDFNMRIKQVG